MVDRFNAIKGAREDSLNCTSNDVQLAQFTNQSSVTECILGETMTVQLRGTFVATSSERWDVGMFVALDGKDPNLAASETGASLDCYNDYLHPVASSSTYDPDGGPYYNGELGVLAGDDTSDLCGDIEQGVTNLYDLQTLTLVCQDNDADGVADVPACTVWANSATTKNDASACQDAQDTTAETTAKCSCGNVPISNITVRQRGTITVTKALSPTSDAGKFDLQIDGVTEADDVGHGGTTGTKTVSAGLLPPGTGQTHTVGEVAGTGTALSNYNSSIACTSDLAHSASASGTGPLSLLVLPDEDWSCTITNTIKPARLTLVKQVTNDNGGTAVATAWTLSASGPTPISGSSGAAAVTSAVVQPGTYSLSESGGPAAYTAGSWNCSGGTQVGSSVTLAPDANATCTITNNDVPPSLTLVKQVVNDNGGTAAATDFVLSATGATPISGAGGVTSGATFRAGTYALGETSPGGYVPSAWNCVGGTQAGSNITLAIGQSATCTIVNDDIAPSLTLVKSVTNDNGGTAAASDFTLTATGPTSISGAGGTSSGAGFSAGTYALSETGPNGYLASAWNCVGGIQAGASITLGLGQSATCTIVNNDAPPSLILVKQVVNDDGGLATATDWTLWATGPTPISGAGGASSGVLFEAGSYALSESGGPAGYTAGSWSCIGGSQTGSTITLGVGQSATCMIVNNDQPGHARVVKTVSGAPPSGSQSFTFQLRQGASTVTSGTIFETANADVSNSGTITFSSALNANTTYQLCEIVMPGWLTSLGTFVPSSFMPPDGIAPNPNVDNSILCVDFSVVSGDTRTFAVDNTPPPGGRALTIGFWKNWASCANNGGHQDPVLDQTLATTEPTGVIVSAGGFSSGAFTNVFLVLHGSTSTPDTAPSCLAAVRLLNKSSITTNKKLAKDPAFNLAAQLVAAKLNYAAGAGHTPAATAAIMESVLLLGKYSFNGATHTQISTADMTRMNQLATILDDYNNNR